MQNSQFSLEGRTAIVTGANGLIGRQHCRALAEAGANVVATDLKAADCQAIAADLPGNAVGIAADVTDKASLEALRDASLERFGSIDILVNNAAYNDSVENRSKDDINAFEDYSLEKFRRSMDINVTGVFLCSQVLGAPMAAQGKGSIINVASTYGIVGPDQSLYINDDGEQTMFKSPDYPASKGAVINFTRFLAAYWGPKGVRVNTLSPGGVENTGQADWFVANYSMRTPLGRMAQPTDYKGAVVYLASDASAYMTGANLVVDGGWTAW